MIADPGWFRDNKVDAEIADFPSTLKYSIPPIDRATSCHVSLHTGAVLVQMQGDSMENIDTVDKNIHISSTT
jgi:hypothetical protein